MSPYQNWLVEQHEHLLTLTLNRAHKLNTLTPAALHELRQIAQQIRADRSVWCVVLQGAGEHFSAGVDVSQIAQLVGQDQETFRAHLRDLQDCIDQFEALPQPTIARIRGHCVGGGLILACACDFIQCAGENLK